MGNLHTIHDFSNPSLVTCSPNDTNHLHQWISTPYLHAPTDNPSLPQSLTNHTPPQQRRHHPHGPQPLRHHPQHRNRNQYAEKDIEPARRERSRDRDGARRVERGVDGGILHGEEEHCVLLQRFLSCYAIFSSFATGEERRGGRGRGKGEVESLGLTLLESDLYMCLSIYLSIYLYIQLKKRRCVFAISKSVQKEKEQTRKTYSLARRSQATPVQSSPDERKVKENKKGGTDTLTRYIPVMKIPYKYTYDPHVKRAARIEWSRVIQDSGPQHNSPTTEARHNKLYVKSSKQSSPACMCQH